MIDDMNPRRQRPEDHPLLIEFRRIRSELGRPPDETKLLRALWWLGSNVTHQVLTAFGMEWEPEERLVLLNAALTEVADHPDAFPNRNDTGSPDTNLRWLYEAMWWTHHSLTNGGTLAQDASFRNIDHLSGQLYNSAYQLIAAMSKPRVPSVELDWFVGHSAVAEELLNERPVDVTMSAVLDHLNTLVSSEEWSWYRGLPYLEDVTQNRRFLVELIEEQPPAGDIDGFWFGIGRGYRPDGVATFDTWPAGGPDYDPDDPEWPANATWEPRGASLNLTSLDEIFDIGERRGLLSGAGDLVVLAFTLCLGREAVKEYKVATGKERVGVCAGFSGGGEIHLGRI